IAAIQITRPKKTCDGEGRLSDSSAKTAFGWTTRRRSCPGETVAGALTMRFHLSVAPSAAAGALCPCAPSRTPSLPAMHRPALDMPGSVLRIRIFTYAVRRPRLAHLCAVHGATRFPRPGGEFGGALESRTSG